MGSLGIESEAVPFNFCCFIISDFGKPLRQEPGVHPHRYQIVIQSRDCEPACIVSIKYVPGQEELTSFGKLQLINGADQYGVGRSAGAFDLDGYIAAAKVISIAGWPKPELYCFGRMPGEPLQLKQLCKQTLYFCESCFRPDII